MSDYINTARKAILEDLKRRFKEKDPSVKPLDPANEFRWFKPQDNYFSGAGQMPCPLCQQGTLQYSRSSYNGHVHGACSNEKCVRWME